MEARSGQYERKFMSVQLTARNLQVSDELKALIDKKIEKLNKLLDGVTDVHVTLTKERHGQVAEVNVHGRGSIYLSATESAADSKSAFQQAIDKIHTQAKRASDRRRTKKRRDHPPEAFGTVAIFEPMEEGRPRIVRSERFEIKPLHVDEAVLALVDSKDEFLVFRNSENGRTNVLYRQESGNYGLIDPDA